MPLPAQPYKAIVPILAQPSSGSVFLGTGFFIDNDGTLLTARHVLTDYGLERREEFQIAMLRRGRETTVERFQLNGIEVSGRFDIALATAVGVQDVIPLDLASKDAGTNVAVLTEEYSGTTPTETGLNILPYTRKGNIICQRDEFLRPGWSEPASVLELSYPALKGSSGAPVLVEQTGEVVGMILDNVEHHLLPAHVERIVDQKGGVTEEHEYFLPVGLAIHWSHLREFVDSIRTAGPS